jgi:hypothetical protein
MESTATTHWKSLRNGVVVSVIVLYLVEPAMKVAVDLAPTFGGRFYRLVWDRAAIQAAIGGDYLGFATFAILFAAIVGAFMGRFGAGAAFPRLFGRKGRKSTDSTWVRWEKRLVMMLMLLVGPIAATTLLVDFAAQQMQLSFDRRITVLAPAITEDSEELLRARFADLAGRADYQSLNDEMNRLARESGVILPEPLL